MVQDLALQRNKYKHLSDEEWRWFLQQVEGRERTVDKLPTFAAIDDWWYPVRLSCEQCSSEATARYKASLCQRSGLSAERSVSETVCQSAGRSLLDLTGGYGVDTYFLSEQFDHTDYVEQNAELCRIAGHNFNAKPITIHHSTAEDFLASAGQYDLIFLDPARRDSHGGKVFKLADCTPNVVELLPTLLSHLTPDGRIMLKLSPMIDLTQALKELAPSGSPMEGERGWDAHIVAVKNEVKEVLLLSRYTDVSKYRDLEPTITAIDLSKKEQAFTFTREEEQATQTKMVNGTWSNGTWIYEPNAAILKAGAYKLVAQRFGLQKLDVNTHLYTSETLVPDFPGRVWKVKEPTPTLPKGKEIKQANVLVRNYPLTAEQLKKKLHLRDGGTAFVIGCRVAGKPTIFLGERVS
ncbi:MAG: SAM-dependent methyltransferase [Paludibacteraceae bacterium]|nr:SAM-dependent methyltransferase [Paludibacteraceae bacterium]